MQKRKLNISLLLKVPIDLEIEVLGVPPTNCHQAEHKKEDTNIFKLIGDSEPEIVISGASLADLDENSQALVSQIVGELEQTGKIFSTFSQTQYEQDKPGNYEQEIVEKYECIDTFSIEDFVAIQPETPQRHKKIMGRFLDSLSDSFALAVNSMGTVLFLGKLANYTWE
ncbi:hypothetical protein LC612_09290 [Nostoc sp. CHAB 5834]|nr:hypothetical protein [Nostoc sp. CHAB 5834]